MTKNRDPSSDDELIARLRAAAGPEPVTHDPYLDLPVAHEVHVADDQTCADLSHRCGAAGRRPSAVQGYFDVEVTEPVACELCSGHEGSHRAGFSQTRFRHHWRAFEWSDQSRAST